MRTFFQDSLWWKSLLVAVVTPLAFYLCIVVIEAMFALPAAMAWTALGIFLLVLGTILGVTYFANAPARRQAKQESEIGTPIEAILANIPQAVYWRDRYGKLIGCNNQFARLLGREMPSEVIGVDARERACWPKPMKMLMEEDRAVINTGTAKRNERAVMRVGNRSVQLQYSKLPVADANGQTQLILSVVNDVTDNHQVHEQVRREAEAFDVVFQSVDDGIAVLNTQGIIQSGNPGMAAILGCDADQLKGKSLLQWCPAAGQDDAASLVPAPGEPARAYELRWSRHGGEMVWVRCRIHRFGPVGTNDERVIANVSDISTLRGVAQPESPQHCGDGSEEYAGMSEENAEPVNA
ncbi:MAG: PAS domain-containing protein [Planctomycetota bacterium]